MKKLNRLLLSILAIFALTLIIHVPAKALVKQTGCSENRIGFAWDDESRGGTCTVVGYALTTSYSTPASYPIPGTTTSAVINMPANYSGNVFLHFKVKDSKGAISRGCWSTNACTQPSSVTSKAAFVVSYANINSSKIEVSAKRPTNKQGFIVELYKGNRRIGAYSSSSPSACSPRLSVAKNAVYSYRIKYWTEIQINGTPIKYYSRNWSPMRKFALCNFTAKAKSNAKGFKITLPKASGVSNYTVFVSKTSRTTGYKKVKTIKPGKKNVAIKKNYKKKATNYIKITPNIPGYGVSDISTVGSLRIYK